MMIAVGMVTLQHYSKPPAAARIGSPWDQPTYPPQPPTHLRRCCSTGAASGQTSSRDKYFIMVGRPSAGGPLMLCPIAPLAPVGGTAGLAAGSAGSSKGLRGGGGDGVEQSCGIAIPASPLPGRWASRQRSAGGMASRDTPRHAPAPRHRRAGRQRLRTAACRLHIHCSCHHSLPCMLGLLCSPIHLPSCRGAGLLLGPLPWAEHSLQHAASCTDVVVPCSLNVARSR